MDVTVFLSHLFSSLLQLAGLPGSVERIVDDVTRTGFLVILKLFPGGHGFADARALLDSFAMYNEVQGDLAALPPAFARSCCRLALQWQCAKRLRSWVFRRANAIHKLLLAPNQAPDAVVYAHHVLEVCMRVLVKMHLALNFRHWDSPEDKCFDARSCLHVYLSSHMFSGHPCYVRS